MRRRVFIVGVWLGLGASGVARALGADAAIFVEPGGHAVQLHRYTPAAGSLERHASRPGAWYALLYLPMAPRWPMELLLWPAERRHEMSLFALDAAPADAPSVVHPLPLALERGRAGGAGRAGARVSRFMLPARSAAPAVYVLIEQWRIAGDQPPPLWVQWQAQRGPQGDAAPWWAAQDADASLRATPPPSPLMQELRPARRAQAHEVPILGLPAALDSGVWR